MASDIGMQRQPYQPTSGPSRHGLALPVGTIAQANATVPLQAPIPPNGSIAGTSMVQPAITLNGSGGVSQAGGLNANGKRPPSPLRESSPSSSFQQERPSKVIKQAAPVREVQAFDLRAEEEAARRANLGRIGTSYSRYAGSGNRGKKQDLYSDTYLRQKLQTIAREYGMTLDDDSMSMIALSSEARLRSLLASSIQVQKHRITSNHLRPPPLSSGTIPIPLWSHRITSDDKSVLDALAQQSKEQEYAIRAARMERIARETEQPRTFHQPIASSAQAPVASETVEPEKKKAGKKKDVSVQAQLKMSNATAMASVMGGGAKKYQWMTAGGSSIPDISSPLSLNAKRAKKKEKEEVAAAAAAGGGAE
ncbi:hypothetical protein P7C73_g5774, partial [Tremellales sp. Uapishka_1]